MLEKVKFRTRRSRIYAEEMSAAPMSGRFSERISGNCKKKRRIVMAEKKKEKLTTASGSPVADNQNSLTAGSHGPLLVQDWQLFEKHAHFNRERIPERVVHAKGSAAFGTLTITHDITKYSKAKVFSQVGKKTECFLRFSTVAGERGAADAERDVRGFAIKFYTEEGKWA